jgi:hypothetical protein
MSDQPNTPADQPPVDPAQQPAAPAAGPDQPPAAPAPDAPAVDQPTELSAAEQEIEQLRAQLAAKDAERQDAIQAALAQARGDQAPVVGRTVVDLSGEDQSARRKRYADWPAEGGSDLPQPWDLRSLGLQNAQRDFDDSTRPGAKNTVSPIVIRHGRPILTSGSADPSVQELGRILGDAGFPNSVSDGTNPFGAVDASIMAAVFAFRDAYGVQEDPSGFGGNTPAGRESAATHIGPWTWEAILRVGRRLDEEDQAA